MALPLSEGGDGGGSPSCFISDLLASGATVTAYDPISMENTRRVFPQIGYGSNAYEVASGADALVVVTEWNEFKQPVIHP